MSFHCPDQYRVVRGEWATNKGDNFGAFFIHTRAGRVPLKVIATDGQGVVVEDGGGWEHVSVSLPDRCPTWEEMSFVKRLFWDAEDCVIQYHPPESDYVNNHPYCLHLWRPTGIELPRPPRITVGFA